MSINIDAKMIVGCGWDTLMPFLTAKVVSGEYPVLMDVLEDLFDYSNVRYDSFETEWIVGFEVRSWGTDPLKVSEDIFKAQHEFESLTGIGARVYCIPHVT